MNLKEDTKKCLYILLSFALAAVPTSLTYWKTRNFANNDNFTKNKYFGLYVSGIIALQFLASAIIYTGIYIIRKCCSKSAQQNADLQNPLMANTSINVPIASVLGEVHNDEVLPVAKLAEPIVPKYETASALNSPMNLDYQMARHMIMRPLF